MGSSGDAALMPQIIEALAPLSASIVVSSAGMPIPTSLPENVYCANYLPGEVIAKRAQLVVCNGGSPTTQQALSEGVPVLGISSNMDQFLNMHFVVARGAGVRLRSDELRVDELRSRAQEILSGKAFRSAAARLAAEMRTYDSSARFAAIVRAAARS
jgi:UDP:flavonoid glycosyltransferase YjiC (YdhE family)